MRGPLSGWLCVLALLSSVPARADVSLLLCEPYGRLGFFSPLGHISTYFDRICADTPTSVRRCGPGETGVVISRYEKMAGLDWVAIPLVPYLYAVEHAADARVEASPDQVLALRNTYREAHLRAIFPDAPGGAPPAGNWIQLVGATFDRRLVAFRIKTTAEQDEAVIRWLNERPNKTRFSYLYRNCADFTRDLLNVYFPGEFKRNFLADLGFTTPKHVAKTLVQLGDRRPDLELSAFVIPQIPGNQAPSKGSRGVNEALVKKLLYVVPLAVVEPWIPASLAVGYLVRGRFDARSYASASYSPEAVERWAAEMVMPAASGHAAIAASGSAGE